MLEKINEARDFIRSRTRTVPKVGIILGSGLGGLGNEVKKKVAIPYDQIPHFTRSTAPAHKGELLLGELAGTPVLVMDGRFHYYEGYGMQEITLPVRVMKALGASYLFVTCASGGMNPQYRSGDIVIIEDHVNLMGDNPLRGPNCDKLGPRFPDMCWPYDRELVALAEEIALKKGIRACKGVYVAVAGPNLETRAEYRFLRGLGADCVGMSTVPEIIVGVHCGLKNLGFAVITDRCLPDALQPANIDEIIRVANETGPTLSALIKEMLSRLS